MKVVKKELVNDDEVSDADAIKHTKFRQWQSGYSLMDFEEESAL